MAQLHIKEFTYSSFIDYANETPRIVGADNRLCEDSVKGSFSFTGTQSYDEAMRLAKYGWETGIKELELEKELIADGQMDFCHEIAGSFVDVGRFLSGIPDCMVNFVDRVERDKPELTVYTMLTYSANKDQKDAQKYAKKILEILVKTNQTHSIKLVGIFCTKNIVKGENIDSIEMVTIKDFYQQFVLNNLAFSFHPSFFRRIWFRFAETTSYRTFGYGTPMSFERAKELLVENKNGSAENWLLPSFQHFGLKWDKSAIYKF